jgi:hypothetical protein
MGSSRTSGSFAYTNTRPRLVQAISLLRGDDVSAPFCERIARPHHVGLLAIETHPERNSLSEIRREKACDPVTEFSGQGASVHIRQAERARLLDFGSDQISQHFANARS